MGGARRSLQGDVGDGDVCAQMWNQQAAHQVAAGTAQEKGLLHFREFCEAAVMSAHWWLKIGTDENISAMKTDQCYKSGLLHLHHHESRCDSWHQHTTADTRGMRPQLREGKAVAGGGTQF